MGIRRGTARRPAGPLLVVNAHLDTVFPEGTDVKVKRQGTRLSAPGHRRRHARARADPRARPHARRGEVHDAGRHPVRRQRRRGRRRGPARHQVPAAEGQVQGPHQADAGDRRQRIDRHHARRRRQQALPRHVQGPRRPQLRRVRPGESGVRDGRRDREVRAPRGARDARRRPTASASSAAARRSTRFPSEVSMDVDMRSESCAELKKIDDAFLAIVREAVDEENRTRSTKEGRDRGRPEGDRRASVRRDGAGRADRPGGGRGDHGVRPDAGVLDQQHRRQRPDEPGHSRRSRSAAAVRAAARTRRTNGPTSIRRPTSEMSRCALAILLAVAACAERAGDTIASPLSMEALMKRWLTTLARVRDVFGGRPRRRHDRADDDGRGRHGGRWRRPAAPSPTMTTRVKGMKIAHRRRMPGTISRRRPSSTWRRSRSIVLRPDQKTATIVTPTAPRRRHRRAGGTRRRHGARVDASVKPTGKSQVIDGIKCDEYTFTTIDGHERDDRRRRCRRKPPR